MKLVFKGNPVTKKNSMQIVGGDKPRLLPSKAYREYEETCLWQIPARARLKLDIPVTVSVTYYMGTRRKVDLLNLLAATHDILVTGEVLADDNCFIIQSVDGSRVKYDTNNPRAEITITEFNP